MMRLAGLRSLLKIARSAPLYKTRRGQVFSFLAFAVVAVLFLPAALLSPNNSSDRSSNQRAISTDVGDQVDSGVVAQDQGDHPASLIPATTKSSPSETQVPASPKIGPAVQLQRTFSITAPVLMYHYVRINPDPADKIGIGLSVPPAEFERQMRYLVDNGYQVVGLEDIVASLRNGSALPPRAVALTFDDGYMDFRQAAYPVLKRYGLKATSFVITDFVGRNGYLTWDAIKEMAAGGLVTFGSHTLSHPDLSTLPPALAERQIRESKRVLEDRLGSRVTLFSYPAGRYNDTVVRLVEEAGYLAAVTTRYGNLHNANEIYLLKRIRIDGRDSLGTFASKLQYVESRGLQAYSPWTTSTKATPTASLTVTPQVIVKPSPGPTKQPFPNQQTAQPTVQPVLSPGINAAATATASSTVVVPSVVGMVEAEARLRLNRSGLDVGYVNYQQVSDVKPEDRAFFLSIPQGFVVSQQPPARTAVKRGEKVNIAVRK